MQVLKLNYYFIYPKGSRPSTSESQQQQPDITQRSPIMPSNSSSQNPLPSPQPDSTQQPIQPQNSAQPVLQPQRLPDVQQCIPDVSLSHPPPNLIPVQEERHTDNRDRPNLIPDQGPDIVSSSQSPGVPDVVQSQSHVDPPDLVGSMNQEF